MTRTVIDLRDSASHTAEVLLAVGETLGAAEELGDALQRLADLALRATRAERCGVFIPDQNEPGRLTPIVGAVRSGNGRDMRRRFRATDPINVTVDAVWLDAWSIPRAVVIDDPGTSPLVPPAWKQWGSKQIAFTTLRAYGERYGLLAVDQTASDREFSDEDVRLLDAIACAAGIALRNASLMRDLRQSALANEALYRLSDVMASGADVRRLLRSLNEHVCDRVGLECLRVALTDRAAADVLRLPSAVGADLALVRGWRADHVKRAEPPIHRDGNTLAVPVFFDHRIAGVLWARADGYVAAERRALLHAIARGFGEAALKVKLRRIGERRALELAVSDERERIARDLHDTVGQAIYGIGLGLQDAIHDCHEDSFRDRLIDLRVLASDALSDLRSAVYSLASLRLRRRGLLAALRALASQFRDESGIGAELIVSGPHPRLDDVKAGALYRVAHEALLNVERHSRATGVVLALRTSREEVELAVTDDGVGIDQRLGKDWRSAARFGLRTMALSMEKVGGKFTVRPSEPRGLVVCARVPANGRMRRP